MNGEIGNLKICPNCLHGIMEDDQGWPDDVVWVCPNCTFRATPAIYREAWDEIEPLRRSRGRKMRLILIALVCAALVIWFLA